MKTTIILIPAALGALFSSACKPAKTEGTATTPAAPTTVATTTPSAGSYPLTTCVVSGEKLGSMGKAYVFEHEGTEVRLCCKMCLKEFKEDPAAHLAKIENARKPEAGK